MNGWTKLHEKAAESVSLSEVLDEEPEAFALFMLMIAKAGVWGRFPGHPKLLKSRVAPLSDRLTAKRISELLTVLERYDLIVRYEVDGVAFICNRNHFIYNRKQAWHRIGKLEFPHPPGFIVPAELLQYLADVEAGKYGNKTLQNECAKMGLMLVKAKQSLRDDSVGVLPGSSPWAVSTLQTLDVRRETPDVQTTDNNLPDSPPPTSSPQASERLYGERDIDEEERKLQADIRSKKAEALDKEKQKRLILADKVSRLTECGKRLFEEIVEYETDRRGGKLLTTSQQIGTVDWVRDKVGAHGEDSVERFVKKAIAAHVNDVTSYVSACFRGNVGQSNGASVGKPAAGTGGNRNSLVVDPLGPWHDAEYDELCKSLKRAEEEKNYDEQQRLMTLIAQKEAPYTHL